MYKEVKGLTRIGTGAFTKAYRKNNMVYAISRDTAKECITLFIRNKKHIPNITRIHYGEYSLYKMPFYRRCTKKDFPEAWSQYQEIAKAFLKFSIEDGQVFPEKGTCFVRNYSISDFCKFIMKQKQIKLSLRRSIIVLVENYLNYIDTVCLEISQRNLGVDSKGNLVLLDIMFDGEAL